LADVTLAEGRDRVYWGLDQSGKYTAKSLYKFMTTGGVRDMQMMAIWKCNIPLKVKIFIWMAMHDRIQVKVQLKRKRWSGPLEYLVCGKVETTDHIFFQCPVAVFLWSFLHDVLGWSKSPTNCADFLFEIVSDGRGINKKINLFICAGALWTKWKTRNDVVFNKKVLSSPSTLIFKTLMLVKSRCPLLKTKLSERADEVISMLTARAA
jgi:hypothetical protein